MTVEQLGEAIRQLNDTERGIITIQVARLLDGRKEYGKWKNETKDNPEEALMECLDGLQYISAELIKLRG